MVCPGKTAIKLPTECMPYVCIKQINQQDYDFFDFDGFIINFQKKIATALLIKREFSFDDPHEVNNESLSQAILNYEDLKELENGINFSTMLSIPLFLTIWPFDYPKMKYMELNNPLSIFEVIKEDNKIKLKLIERGNEDTLKSFIRKYRNFSFSFVKPMTISKTFMDYFLSTTSDPWPGDLDGILKKNRTGEIEALLEFKTHNLSSPITEESVDKYGKQDFRRFKVLFYLQKQIKELQGFEPLILYIIWGTGDTHKEVKIQILSNESIINEYLVETSISDSYNNLFNKIKEITE